MKIDKLVKLIKVVIKKEIKASLREVINEEVKRQVDLQLSILTEDYDSNPLSESTTEEWPTLNNKTVTSPDAVAARSALHASFRSLNDNADIDTATPVAMMPMQDVNGRPVDINTLPATLQTALTKDYSSMIKAMDKPK